MLSGATHPATYEGCGAWVPSEWSWGSRQMCSSHRDSAASASPPRAARLAASRRSRTGAVVFGGYSGMALRLLQETAVAAGRERLLAASLAALGGLALAALSLWLEHICRLPHDHTDGTQAPHPS